MSRTLPALALAILGLPLAAGQVPVPSFRNDIVPILTKASCNSGPCHGATDGKNGFKLSLRGHDPAADHRVITRASRGRRVAKMAPAHSLILLKPTGVLPHGGGRRIDIGSPDYKIVSSWIAGGAPGPRDRDPRILDIEVLPPHILKTRAGEHAALKVLASYSDGTRKEVTRWAKYESTDVGVAAVDENGKVTTKGPGEAAVTVWYSSKVSFSRVTVPFDREIRPEVFKSLPRSSYIDDLVFKKLKQLRIEPSTLSDDSVFLRRMYLDVLGILPEPEELELFLNDPDPDKRNTAIDRALGRPEFVDYLTYRWSDLLLVSSEKLDPAAVRAYYRWIRESVRVNKPWNQLVYDLLTARGNTLVNGAANYWVIHQDPIDMSENLSLTFLGISMTCARCHNHPLEKWTQDQYYGFANLVSRVSLKDGTAPGEIDVISAHMGDVSHPKLGRPVPPQPLDRTPLDPSSTTDRREHLAEWLTSAENPYFSRTVVNRIWAAFMGRGLVHPVDDLRATNPSSNEALLAALSRDFVDHGFDVQHLIRRILHSTSYQLSSETTATNQSDQTFYSHRLIRRLPAEIILDIICQVTGVPEVFEGFPEGIRAIQLPDSKTRSYFLDSFGRPARVTPNSSERTTDSTVAQVLHLINGETINRKLNTEGKLIEGLLDESDSSSELVERVYRSALARSPTGPELDRLLEFLGPTPQPEAVKDLVWAVLTSKEFLFTR